MATFEERVVKIMLAGEGFTASEITTSDLALQAEMAAGMSDARPYARATWRIADGAALPDDPALVAKVESTLPAPALRSAKTVAALFRRGMRGADIETLKNELSKTDGYPALRELGLTVDEISLLEAANDPANASRPDKYALQFAELGKRIGGAAFDLAQNAVSRRAWVSAMIAKLQSEAQRDVTPGELDQAKAAQAASFAKAQIEYGNAKESERQKILKAKEEIALAEAKAKNLQSIHSRAAMGLLT